MPQPTSELPANQLPPDPADEKCQYRAFSVEDKKRILAEADARQRRRELGALLRREGLYSP